MPMTVDFRFQRVTRKPASRVLLESTDGDTTVIKQPIRMVSCDTPEKAQYAGKPDISQPKLDKCRERLQNGFYDALPRALRTYLVEKLSADAAKRHIDASIRASQEFNTILATRLARPEGGTPRNVATIPTGQLIDDNCRLLAYIAPWFADTQADPLPLPNDPRRRTINLDMIANGWAAFFPIYPSLPKNDDMNLAIREAKAAWDGRRGIWREFGESVLLGYEYRMCIKLAKPSKNEQGEVVPDQNPQERIDEAFERICVSLEGDHVQEVGDFGFHGVEPWARLWFWKKEADTARRDLDLV